MEILGGPILYDNPQWVVEGGFSNQELEDIIRQRVREVMKSQPFIKFWTVTNEVGSSWRNDFLVNRLGAYKYLEIAYSEARAANPNAVLIFNDSVNHFFPRNGGYSELPKDLKMLRYLKNKGLVDAVGLHMHLNKNQWSPMPTEEEFQKALEAYKSLGIKVYITEMDVSLYNYPPEQKERFLLQAKVYKKFYKNIFREWCWRGNANY